MPNFIKYTAAAKHDQQFYDCINELPGGSIITFDKAYINYQQFEKFEDREITYVVPQKDNAKFKSIKELDLLDTEPLILKDEIIEVKYVEDIEGVAVKRTLELRRIAYYSQKHTATYIYWTNNLELTATEVVQIYQNRWQIEKFFKRLKQNFPLNYFLGDNENAIHIQIWCALIGLLLLQVLYKENTATIAFSILAAIVSIHLMNYTCITVIINRYKKKRARKPDESIIKIPKKKGHPQIQPQFAF